MIKQFSQISSQDVGTCGGKWASLGEMTQAGFPVPNWFVLTTKAFWVNSHERDDKVLHAFDQLDCKFVAVRSSGTKEDGIDDSFAGQFDTYLFVTKEKLIEQIIECHNSIDSNRIISYCESKNINRKDIKVAVVVQKMVNSDVAGVCFTVNPVSGETDEVMIEAGYGVWEAVVSGMITPDNYIIDKITGTIQKTISEQIKKLVLDIEQWWTKEEQIESTIMSSQKLSDNHILELAEYAKNIEKHYGKPMDTEWAVEDGKLYILQARPITTNIKKNIYEDIISTKRLDDRFLLEEIKWSSPLLFAGIFRRLTWRFNEEFNIPIEINLIYKENTSYLYFKHKQLNIASRILLKKSLDNVNFLYEIDQNNKKTQEETFAFANKLIEKDIEIVSDEELMSLFQEYALKLEQCIVVWRVDNILEFENEFFSTTLRNYLSRIIKEKNFPMSPAEAFSIFSTPNRKTRWLQQEDSLQDIAQKIKNDQKLLNFFLENDVNTISQDLKSLSTMIDEKIESHTKKYEWYFFMYEWPTWKKLDFISAIKNILADAKSKEIEENIINIKADLIQKLNIDEYHQKLLDEASEIVFNKDLRKHAIYYISYVWLRLFEEIGKRSNLSVRAVRCILPREMQDLSISTIKNIDLWSRENWFIMRFYEGNQNVDFTTSEVDKFFKETQEKNKVQWDIKILKWSCAFPWMTTWVVKIIDSPEDMYKMNEWEILVSHQTDPDILPAMKLAKAFITDLGGITCHAAIVSREMKKICIVWTKIATQILKDWDIVEVDADNGIVRILK